MIWGDCRRDPWGLRQLLRHHPVGTGVIVYGWYNRLRGWASVDDWDAVVVTVDGRQRAILEQLARGPVWINLKPGEHVVAFIGDGRSPLRSERVLLEEREATLIAFRPQERIPFRRPTRERWCIRRLR